MSNQTVIETIQKKFDYVLSRVQEGPLFEEEKKELEFLLWMARNNESIWGVAISNHFQLANTDQEQDISSLIEQLASQCVDDIFTMTCVVGQNAVILLLRTLNK